MAKKHAYTLTKPTNAYENFQSPEYTGAQYNDAAYKNKVDTSYYTDAANRYKNYAEKNRATQLGQAAQSRDSALKEAYITRMQNERALGDRLARSGIRGGATETSNLRLQNVYGQQRAAANADYSNSVNSINQAIDQNIFDYQSDMDARAEEYRQNMAQNLWNADREDYANRYNAAREDAINRAQAQQEINNQLAADKNARAQNVWERRMTVKDQQREDKQQQFENTQTRIKNLQDQYVGQYGGYPKKKLKKMRKEIKRKIDSGKFKGGKLLHLQAQLYAIGINMENKK